MDHTIISSLHGLDRIEGCIASLKNAVSYFPDEKISILVDTCYFGAIAHRHQRRQSGEPYICHPIKVAEILAIEAAFDLAVLQAAILHDVIEDTPVSKKELSSKFSKEVANLVDGVSKFEKDKDSSPELIQAQTFAKLVHAMEADPRVVMIKFADRMHNMQTLDSLRPDKRKRIANETLEVYVPIASRLGMYLFKTELEELAFKHVHPWRYKIIEKIIQDNPERKRCTKEVKETLTTAFKEINIDVSIEKRRRNLLNVYKKVQKNRITRRPLENASIPFILLTSNTEDCYRVLYLIHHIYRPISRKLIDYIASPKANGYQSIHTSVVTQSRRIINFQIRSKDMHAISESGVIAIWRQHNKEQLGIKTARSQKPKDKSIRRWLGSVKNLQTISTDPIEYYQTVKRDLGGLDVHVFTPKGDPIALPQGSTVIDFAYYVHTNLGNHFVSAKVNDIKVVPEFILSNGQTIEITAEKSAIPHIHWIRIVKTARARAALRYYFNSIPKDKLQEIGFTYLKDFIRSQGYHFKNFDQKLSIVCKKRKITIAQLSEKIALDEISKAAILNEIKKEYLTGEEALSKVTITVLNQPGALAKLTEVIAKSEANIQNIVFDNDMSKSIVEISFILQISFQEQLILIIEELRKINLIIKICYMEDIEIDNNKICYEV